MKRRKSLQNTSLGIAGFLYFHGLIVKQDTILGHNNKKYRLNARWSQADAVRYPVNDCHEMVQDKKGRILLLTNDTHNNVLIYNKNGKILDAWGTDYPGAHGLTLFNENGEDVLFICDNNRHQVIKTTMKGKVLMTLDYPIETGLYSKPDDYVPTETAIAPNGDIYIADGYGKDYSIQYNYKGVYIRHFGGRGETDAHLLNAHGICIDDRNNKEPSLIVTSRQQNAIKQYDKYVRFADRAARFYTPAVHTLAAGTLLGWWLLGGMAFPDAVLIAVTVLIITCPCALGLAVPVVQVLATGRLMRQHVLVKSGDALERMATIDTVLFDKTGTLTLSRPALLPYADIRPAYLRYARTLASQSHHPLSRALLEGLATSEPVIADCQVQEFPGQGLEASIDGQIVRLGSR